MKERLKYNWTLYLYLALVIVSTIFNFTAPIKYNDEGTKTGLLNPQMWFTLGIFLFNYIKLLNYFEFRDNNPIIMIFFNRAIYVGLTFLVFKSMYINWIIFTIGFVLEFLVCVVFYFDVRVFNYVREKGK